MVTTNQKNPVYEDRFHVCMTWFEYNDFKIAIFGFS
jgi:hypothetical protein